MGARGSCSVCSDPRRPQIDAARAEGTPVATVARNFNIATTTLGRHFAHARPAPAPVPRPAAVSAPAPRHPRREDPDPAVDFAKVKKAAAFLGVPLGELAACLENHLEVHVAAATEAEEAELFAGWDEADGCDEYCQAIVRTGKFLEETAAAAAAAAAKA